MQAATRSQEIVVMVWQAFLGVMIAGACLLLVTALLRRPEGGWDCDWCDKASCTDFLGWSCAYALPPGASSCEYFIFPNSTVTVECPLGGSVLIDDFTGTTDAEFSSLCQDRCITPSLPPAPAPPDVVTTRPGNPSPGSEGTLL